MSAMLNRDSGSPVSEGSSQASALISTTTLGGETAGPAPPRTVTEAVQSLEKEALAPLAHDLSFGIGAQGDLVVAEAFGRQQYHLGPHYIAIR
jgi:hypothetical protein